MLVATHGRALWILDHLEPIQEYAAAHAASADVKLFTVPTALEWKTKDDRNDEFWGHQYFVGENPPNEAVVQYLVNKPISNLELRVTDAAGKVVRESAVPAAKSQSGIQTVCWDMRVEPIPAPAADSAAGGRGGRGGGRGGRGGGRGAASPAVPGVPQPVPTAYTALNPCATPGDSASAGRGGGGGFGGGALGGPGPYVLPGTYTVALTSGGKVLDSKPLKIVFDPDVHFAPTEAARYNAMVMDLHALQRRATAAAVALNALYPQMGAVSKQLGEKPDVPANVKAQFAALEKQLDSVRAKFGVPLPAPGGRGGGGGGGGGGRGGAADPENVLARVSALKQSLMGVWEPPSAALVQQYESVKVALPKAVAGANAVLARAASVSGALARYDVTLTVSPAAK
jgi:hypothetical protein